MEPGIVIALIVGIVVAIYNKQNEQTKYIIRERNIFDDLIGNK